MIRTGRRRAAATAGPLRDSDIRVLRCQSASRTAPQIGGERCVWNNSRRTDLREPAEIIPMVRSRIIYPRVIVPP
jgi:hypothetical protein